MSQERYRIGEVYISATNPQDAEERITLAARNGEKGYICVSNAYTVDVANADDDYLRVMNEAFMCLPDGTPLLWMARLWGLKYVQRTDGPDLFVSMLNKPESGIKHFLLGDTEETLSGRTALYPTGRTPVENRSASYGKKVTESTRHFWFEEVSRQHRPGYRSRCPAR